MSCDITKGRLEPCKDNVGGLKNMYIVNFDPSIDKLAVITDAEITDVADEYDAYKFELRGENNVEEAGQTSRENGTTFWESTAAVVLKKQDKITQKELQLLSFGRPHIIFEDYNGNFRLFGSENGCEINVTSNSGTAMEDLNGYNLEIVSKEKNMAYFVEPTLIGITAGGGDKGFVVVV